MLAQNGSAVETIPSGSGPISEKSMHRALGASVAVASLVFVQGERQHADFPETMTKIVVRLMGPGIKPGSFAALPRTIYRAGNRYARLEDPPDTRQRIEKLIIIAEPDAYSLNVIEKKGTHAIDRGGPNDIHLPVVLPFDPKHELGGLDRLEFDSELDFFENAGARKRAGPIVNARPTDAYVLHTPEGSATLVVRAGTERPIFITWMMKEGTYRYEYIQYDEIPFNPALFAKPNGFELKEIRPGTDQENPSN